MFCAYNSGSTTVTVTTGLLSYSLPVTVQPGGVGAPCGTVPGRNAGNVIVLHSAQSQRAPGGAGAPPPPAPAALSGINPSITLIPQPAPLQAPPVAAPVPKPATAPAAEPSPLVEPTPLPAEQVPPAPVILPAATPPVEPIPPGGAAQAPSAAERREKARKHASQSAYTIRPAGTSGEDWFYAAVAITTLLALLLSARGLGAGPRSRPAVLREPVRRR